MTLYQLYLESGLRRTKTMVHVLELLGCVANGPTTEAALDKTPGAIRDFRRFLQSHGAAAAGDDAVEMAIAEHIKRDRVSMHILRLFMISVMPDGRRFALAKWMPEALGFVEARPRISFVLDTAPITRVLIREPRASDKLAEQHSPCH